MRKNRSKHEAKKPRLAKRALALCFALIFVCSCLLPAFANGSAVVFDAGTETNLQDGGSEGNDLPDVDSLFGVDAQEAGEQDADEQDAGEQDAVPQNETNVPSTETNVPSTQPAAGGAIVVGSGDVTSESTGMIETTDKDNNIVYVDPNVHESDEVLTPSDDPADSVIVSRPDSSATLDKVDAGFSLPTNIYHFWLKEMSSNDLDDISTDAKAADMTVEQYLAMYGKDKGCYHIMTAADGADLNDYKFANPTFLDDSEGRDFAGWYTIDEFGDKHDFTFDQTLFISTGTTVEVFAAWKEATQDDTTADTDEEKSATKELSELKTNVAIGGTDMTVKIDGMPEKATKLAVEELDENTFDSVYNTYCDTRSESERNLTPLVGFEITPKDDLYSTVQPDFEATVSISGLNDWFTGEETLKVLHLTRAGRLEILDADYTDGTLTFKTMSFSPFVVALVGNGVSTMEWNPESDLPVVEVGTKEVTIVVGNTETLTGDSSGWAGEYYRWVITEGYDIVSVQSIGGTLGSSATVIAENVGNAVVKHYYKKYYNNGYKTACYTYNITVSETPAVLAQVYYMALPTNNPLRNESKYWSNHHWDTAEVKIPAGTKWVNGTNNEGTETIANKNLVIDGNAEKARTYIVSWPDGTNGATFTLTKDKYPTEWNDLWNAYKTDLEEKLGVELTDSDVESITLVPYKISQNNGTNPDYHIDCTVDIKCKGVYTAKFWVDFPNGVEQYSQVHAKNYKSSEDVEKYSGVPALEDDVEVPANKIGSDGKTYVFDGWYKDQECTQKLAESDWPNNPGNEIKQNGGTVNYYGRYVRASSEVDITKKVTGLFGERTKEFGFTVTGVANSFNLSNGQNSKTEAKAGDTLTITETGAAGYTTKAVVVDASGNPIEVEGNKLEIPATEAKESDTKTMVIPVTDVMVTDSGIHITVINDKDGPVDNGILLDTLPYLIILGIALAGAAALLIRKKKHDDE